MKNFKQSAIYFIFIATAYTALIMLWSLLAGDALEVWKNLAVGLTFAGVMTFSMHKLRSEKEIIAYVPPSEMREGIDWRNLEVVKQHLQAHHADFQKAEVLMTEAGLEFRFRKFFPWQRYKLLIKSVEDGLHLHGADASELFAGEDYAVRIKLLTARKLLAREAA